MIIYSALAQVSLNDMFLAGVVPGLVLALVILVCALILAWQGGYGPAKGERPTSRSILDMSTGRLLQTALPISLIPLIIVASIYLGWATPTESASVAMIYAIVVTLLQGRLTRPMFMEAVMESVRVMSAIALLIAVTQMFAFVITYYRWPQALTEQIIAIGMTAIVFLMVTNVLLIILGIPLEPAPLLFLVVPIVAPVLPALGINPVHFGIIVIVNLGLAVISPPVGLVLFTLASVTGTKSEQVFRAVLPFCAVILIGLLIITYVPSLSLFFKK
jgi:tripartite ATP-independent transporter DctM subunit